MATVGQSNLERAIEMHASGCDLDAIYDAVYANQVQPGEFRGMVYSGSVEDEIIDRCRGGKIDAVFAEVYPEYVSRHDFREVMAAALTKQSENREVAAEVETEDITDEDE